VVPQSRAWSVGFLLLVWCCVRLGPENRWFRSTSQIDKRRCLLLVCHDNERYACWSDSRLNRSKHQDFLKLDALLFRLRSPDIARQADLSACVIKMRQLSRASREAPDADLPRARECYRVTVARVYPACRAAPRPAREHRRVSVCAPVARFRPPRASNQRTWTMRSVRGFRRPHAVRRRSWRSEQSALYRPRCPVRCPHLPEAANALARLSLLGGVMTREAAPNGHRG
jgi:hypothetical protein